MCPCGGLWLVNADSLRQIRLGAVNTGHLGLGSAGRGGEESGGGRVSACLALDGKE